MKYERIMLALASPGGTDPRVIAKAVRLAAAMRAELELFHCIYDAGANDRARFGSRGPRDDIREVIEQRRQQLEHQARDLRACGIAVRTSVRWDSPPYEGIVRQVVRHGSDLLIAQSMRRSRPQRALFSHTDYRLIESCPCPLLLVKSPRPYRAGCTVAAVDPRRTHGKPAELDDAILQAAKAFSTALGNELCLYHAYPPWTDAARRDPELRRIPEVEKADARSSYQEAAESPLRGLARRHQLPAEGVRTVEGDVSDVLPEFTRHQPTDLVVFGLASRPFVKQVLIGHTAKRLLDRLACDVLIVKPAAFRSRVPRASAHRLDRSSAGAQTEDVA
jgi:universal stress protein E